MSTRTRFEDRLLEELKREIGLREEDLPSAEDATGERGTSTSTGRLVTPRRIALAAATCAVAGLAMVLVPGTPTESVAFAVEPHGNDRVTVTIKKQDIGIDAQYDLAEELRPAGIVVDVAVLDPGYSCKPWGTVAALDLVTVDGDSLVQERGHAWAVPVRVTLSRGNVLVFENSKGDAEPRAVHAYEIDQYALDSSAARDESKPCVPVKSTP